MKAALLLFAIATVHIASSLPVAEDEPVEKQYPRFFEMPDTEGNVHLVDLEGEPNMEVLEEITRNPANNAYYLYTRSNRIFRQTLTHNNAASIRNSNFNPALQTIVSVHGWQGGRSSEPNSLLRSAYLDRANVNVIVLDWSRLAGWDYVTAANGVSAVGQGLGDFLNFLATTTGANLNNFHLIGFSLGAHLVGNAGRRLNGRVARVTGLDPAGPLWGITSSRLRGTDAVYVEAIHTDGGLAGLGIGSAIANVDFFPNGGNSQPGCLTSICNHYRANELMAATVTRNHLVGRRCTTSTQVTWNTCTGAQLNMGNDALSKSGSGMYRLDTGRSHPF